jgi:[ribosomal protein S5]-alanine N-acetyltransferase
MSEYWTQRLHLRPITMGDLGDLHEIFGDPVAMKFFPKTRAREELIPLVERSFAAQASDGTGFFALLSRETGEFLGQCGLLWQQVDGLRELEIGYHCKRRHWRKGYASEAALCLRDVAFEKHARPHIISLIRPGNEASFGVARRMGMSLWKEAEFKGMDVHVMRLLRDEYLKIRASRDESGT